MSPIGGFASIALLLGGLGAIMLTPYALVAMPFVLAAAIGVMSL